MVDNRYHVNFWLSDRNLEVPNWQSWLQAWTLTGQDVVNVNNQEVAKELNFVELIDPVSISSPSNVML